MKKIIIAVIVILIVICISLYVYNKYNQPIAYHDGTTGTVTFEKLSQSPIGYGVEFTEGEVPFEVELTNGTLKLEVLKNGNTIYEEEFNSSESTTVNIPEDGLYLIQISGEKATGTIKYQVSDITETKVTDDDIKNLVGNNDPAEEAVLKYLKETFVDDVENITITDFKLYTEDEVKDDEILEEAFNDGKIPFEVTYEIELTEGADGMAYTAASGELDGNVVKDKSNVGYLIEKNGVPKNYEVEPESFGTGF